MKRHIKKTVDLIHSLTFWQLVLTLLVLVPLTLFSLRHNNQTMGELKLAVIEADRQGVQADIETALNELNVYVSKHMNTSTDVTLAETYNRRVSQIQEQASRNLRTPDLFPAGQAACASVPTASRQQCVQDYIVERSADMQSTFDVEFPEKGLYRFSFAAPLWSPDLAGLALLGSGISFLLIAFKLIHKKIHPDEQGGF